MSTEETTQTEVKAPTNIKVTGLILLLVVLLALFTFFPALLIVLSIGFMPTVGAAISDPTPNRAQTSCVGFCNLAALVPSLHQIYLGDFTMNAAYGIIHDQFHLLYILGVSSIGWALFFVVPSVTISMYKARDKMYLIRMVKRYHELKEIWGDALPESDIMNNPKVTSKQAEKDI